MISNLPKRIFLCGFMGSGKSAIGRQLAEILDVSYLDLDEAIVERVGSSIPEIFGTFGEKGFRETERKILFNVVRDYEGVVSLGGGSLQNQHIADHLKLNGLLVFIEVPISVILERISQDKNRPLLLDEQGNPKNKKQLSEEMTALYGERLPFYEQAVIKIKNDGTLPVRKIVKQLVNKIRNHVEYC